MHHETLKQAGYELIDRPAPREIVILNLGTGHAELWAASNPASYALKVGGHTYEFVREVKADKVKISVQYSDEPEQDYAFVTDFERAAEREPWAKWALSHKDFVCTSYREGVITTTIRAFYR